jgi:hypothetical protein
MKIQRGDRYSTTAQVKGLSRSTGRLKNGVVARTISRGDVMLKKQKSAYSGDVDQGSGVIAIIIPGTPIRDRSAATLAD